VRSLLLWAITLEKARSDLVLVAEDKLLTDLASQAGLALRNVRLTAELRATIDALRASRRPVRAKTTSGSGSNATCTTGLSSSWSRSA
jgi:GAF domain-containing protein